MTINTPEHQRRVSQITDDQKDLRLGRSSAFVSLARNEVRLLAANLRTQVIEISSGNLHFPATTNGGGPESTCYICCPSAAYVDYALDELRNIQGPLLRRSLKFLIGFIGRPLLAASNVDRQVQLNNWLFATNVIPPLDYGSLSTITGMICNEHRDKSLVWRSLNEYRDADAIGTFRKCGYRLWPSRQIYLFDCREQILPLGRDERRDSVLLLDDEFAWVRPADIKPTDFERIAWLYSKLYVGKYTPLNPQYEADFLRALHERQIVEFHGLRGMDGDLAGVIGLFESEDTITAPIVGYDTTLPASKGLYRRLMSVGQQLARERRLLFNMSAGAAGFKRNRKALPAIEYMAIYNRHLGWKRRVAAFIVEVILTVVALPLLRRLEL